MLDVLFQVSDFGLQTSGWGTTLSVLLPPRWDCDPARTYRQTDRQANRQASKQASRQPNTLTGRQTRAHKLTSRQTDKQTSRHAKRHISTRMWNCRMCVTRSNIRGMVGCGGACGPGCPKCKCLRLASGAASELPRAASGAFVAERFFAGRSALLSGAAVLLAPTSWLHT